MHELTPSAAAERLKTDLTAGLSPQEAARRLERDGPNELEAAEPISAWRILVNQFANLMVLILIAAAGIALISWWLDGAQGLPSDALVVAAIVVLNAVLGFFQEYRAERTLQELKRVTAARAQVVRGGAALSLERSELVVGDLVVLQEGDKVPADLLLVDAQRLQLDESMLTGESLPVTKRVGPLAADTPVSDRLGSAFAGTTVTSGRASGLVVATGSRTELGGIATSLATTASEETPLERRLDRLGKQIGWAVLAISTVVGATVLAVEGAHDTRTVVHVLLFAVALAVAAVPEGLPAVLTVSLSIGARRLARQNAVVRRMAAVETLGSVTVIVTDKTGTLTHNQMTVSALFCEGQERAVSGQGYEAEGKLEGQLTPEIEWLLMAGALANSARLEVSDGRRQALGDPTDAAFLVLAEKAGIDWQGLQKDNEQLGEVPFTSDRRRASSLRRFRGSRWLFCKGSLDTLEQLSEAPDPALREAELRFAERGLRAIALAVREVPEGYQVEDLEQEERSLRLLGLVAMGDPPRAEVPQAMAECRQAGIRVIMLTGDHPQTARSIADQVGLLDPEHQAVYTGQEVDALSDAEVDERLSHANVFARVSPHAKLRLVERLLARGEVVAMTGDGVNDAPALKKVHVGVAMGKAGTAVAVEASELVLLDDNFATIVTAVRLGRGVFANVQKFIAFLFSGNVGVVLAMFIGTILAGIFNLRVGVELLLPLTAAQILWMNLVTDGAPAVAFSLTRAQKDVMLEPPRRPDSPILSPSIWAYVFLTGSTVCALLLAVLDATYQGGWFTVHDHDYEYARTAGFYTVVTARLFNSLNFRQLPQSFVAPGFWRDLAVPVACLASWGMTLAAIYFPPLRDMFHLVPLDLEHLVLFSGLACAVLLPGWAFVRLHGIQMNR
ncbi:cation-transporting P-type ATPase [bacterium CPR1]|nr:cation-transporting P-type ATPase [bacterium CPR1]